MTDKRDNLKSVLNTLIAMSRQRRDGLLKSAHHQSIDPERFAHEACSIILNAGRQAGHTSAMAEMFRQEQGDQIILFRPTWKKRLMGGWPPIPENTIWVESIYRPRLFGNPILINRDSIIWMDACGFTDFKARKKAVESVVDETEYAFGRDNIKQNLPIIVQLG